MEKKIFLKNLKLNLNFLNEFKNEFSNLLNDKFKNHSTLLPYSNFDINKFDYSVESQIQNQYDVFENKFNLIKVLLFLFYGILYKNEIY